MNVHGKESFKKRREKNTYPPHHICKKRLSHFPFQKLMIR